MPNTLPQHTEAYGFAVGWIIIGMHLPQAQNAAGAQKDSYSPPSTLQFCCFVHGTKPSGRMGCQLIVLNNECLTSKWQPDHKTSWRELKYILQWGTCYKRPEVGMRIGSQQKSRVIMCMKPLAQGWALSKSSVIVGYDTAPSIGDCTFPPCDGQLAHTLNISNTLPTFDQLVTLQIPPSQHSHFLWVSLPRCTHVWSVPWISVSSPRLIQKWVSS